MDEEILKKIEGLITDEGFKISGNGIIIKKLTRLIELQDKTNLKLHFIEKKLENLK